MATSGRPYGPIFGPELCHRTRPNRTNPPVLSDIRGSAAVRRFFHRFHSLGLAGKLVLAPIERLEQVRLRQSISMSGRTLGAGSCPDFPPGGGLFAFDPAHADPPRSVPDEARLSEISSSRASTILDGGRPAGPSFARTSGKESERINHERAGEIPSVQVSTETGQLQGGQMEACHVLLGPRRAAPRPPKAISSSVWKSNVRHSCRRASL